MQLLFQKTATRSTIYFSYCFLINLVPFLSLLYNSSYTVFSLTISLALFSARPSTLPRYGKPSQLPIMSSDAWKSVPFPIPTLDRPFGVEVWPIFEQLWTSFRSFPPQDFRFVSGTTPLSTLKETAAVLISYYVIILGGRELMKNRSAFSFNPVFMMHNLGLTIISGGLLALFIEQLLPTVWRHGIFFAICDERGGWTEKLVTLYYVYTRDQH